MAICTLGLVIAIALAAEGGVIGEPPSDEPGPRFDITVPGPKENIRRVLKTNATIVATTPLRLETRGAEGLSVTVIGVRPNAQPTTYAVSTTGDALAVINFRVAATHEPTKEALFIAIAPHPVTSFMFATGNDALGLPIELVADGTVLVKRLVLTVTPR